MADNGSFFTTPTLAAATNGSALPKVFTNSGKDGPAVAATFPDSTFFDCTNIPDSNAHPKSLSSNIHKRGGLSRQLCHGPASTSITLEHAAWVFVELACKFGNNHFAVIRSHVVNAVFALFVHRCPSAVTRLIVTIIVDPFNARIGRTNTHIKKEMLKTVQPSIANGYSSAAISTERSSVGVCAPLNHARPRNILTCFCHAVFCDNVLMQTAARHMFPASQIRSTGNHGRATIATALPCGLSGTIFRAADNIQPAKLLAS